MSGITPEFLTRLDGCGAHGLAMLRSRSELKEVLNVFCRSIEDLCSRQMLVSVLIYEPENGRLREGAAPSLPEHYNRAVDGLKIGLKAGSCGTAAFCRHPVYVVDIAVDPLWEDFRALALPIGLHACWSVPLDGEDGRLLGTLAMYYQTPRSPTSAERQLITHAAALASRLLAQAGEEIDD